MEDHDAAMLASAITVLTIHGEKVIPIVSHDRALIPLGVGEQVGVGETTQARILVDRRDVVTAGAQLLGDASRKHLVKQ